MIERESRPITDPLYSVIVAIYNDWVLLDRCLRSLAEQINAPKFEVVVVDDGSETPSPEFVHRWEEAYPLTVVRQPHRGVAAARNRGIKTSKGAVMVFVDADCKLKEDCLATLAETVSRSAQHNCFQLRITGDCSGLVGKSEELRLLTLQNHMLQPNGCIRYLNTSGFAIRREGVEVERGLFNPAVVRAEDTLLLANLMLGGKLPLFVSDAVVQHAIPLSLVECFTKDIRSAYRAGKTFDLIASMGVRLRVSHRERANMLLSMWRTSGRDSIGRLAWFVVLVRHALARTVSVTCRCFRLWPNPPGSAQSS